MGFFSKIKQNFTHGGVKVTLHAPASTSMQGAALPVSVDITATDASQVIKSVRVEIIAVSRNKSFNQPAGGSNTDPAYTEQIVARTENVEGFTLQPNETKTVQLNITMNAGQAITSQLPQDSALGKAVQALQTLQSVSQVLDQNSYTYYVKATADVDGIAMDPSHKLPIQIYKPGETGIAARL
jgi:hypothetical protein